MLENIVHWKAFECCLLIYLLILFIYLFTYFFIFNLTNFIRYLTLSWRMPLSYRNQSTDLHGLRHERVYVLQYFWSSNLFNKCSHILIKNIF